MCDVTPFICDIKIKPEVIDSEELSADPDVGDSVTISYVSSVIDITNSNDNVESKPACRSSLRLRNRRKSSLDSAAVPVKKEAGESENATAGRDNVLTMEDSKNFRSKPTSAGRTVRKARSKKARKISGVRRNAHSECQTYMKARPSDADLQPHIYETSLKCKFCSLHLATSAQLLKHQRTHNFERPFKCQWCIKSYQSAAYLREHVRVHTGERPFQCAFCVKTFITSTGLRVHERIHTGEKPYKCGHCGKAFTTNGVMRAHERIHTGEKPYKCVLCSRAFTKSGHLRRHENIHADIKTLHLNKNLFFVL